MRWEWATRPGTKMAPSERGGLVGWDGVVSTSGDARRAILKLASRVWDHLAGAQKFDPDRSRFTVCRMARRASVLREWRCG